MPVKLRTNDTRAPAANHIVVKAMVAISIPSKITNMTSHITGVIVSAPFSFYVFYYTLSVFIIPYKGRQYNYTGGSSSYIFINNLAISCLFSDSTPLSGCFKHEYRSSYGGV